MYTLEDLDKAMSELARWQKKWDDYSGNNPDKYQADIKAARRKIREIERSLKGAGVLPKTAQEMLEDELDQAFPDATSNSIVEYKGKKYQRKFHPVERSRSRKTVTEWERSWLPIES